MQDVWNKFKASKKGQKLKSDGFGPETSKHGGEVRGEDILHLISEGVTTDKNIANHWAAVRAGQDNVPPLNYSEEYLRKRGIPGLKYFDGMSRANTKAKISIDGVPDSTGAGGWVLRQNESNPQKALDKAINEIESFGKPLQGSASETDLATLKMWKKSPNSVEISNPRTRNFVTWDQDVLNRMKLLERNGESMVDALSGVNNK